MGVWLLLSRKIISWTIDILIKRAHNPVIKTFRGKYVDSWSKFVSFTKDVAVVIKCLKDVVFIILILVGLFFFDLQTLLGYFL